MAKIIARTEFDENYNNKKYARGDFGPSMTDPSQAADCDINNIIRKNTLGIPCTHYIEGELTFGDFSDVPDYLEAQNRIAEANEQFDALPAHIRERFDNNPAKLIGFISDKANLSEAIKLGLATAPITAADQNIPQNAVVEPKTVST